MKSYTVTIVETADKTSHGATVSALDQGAAISHAVSKIFGNKTHWARNVSMHPESSRQYGQVVGGSGGTKTGNSYLDVSEATPAQILAANATRVGKYAEAYRLGAAVAAGQAEPPASLAGINRGYSHGLRGLPWIEYRSGTAQANAKAAATFRANKKRDGFALRYVKG